jgi:hypothetical protein
MSQRARVILLDDLNDNTTRPQQHLGLGDGDHLNLSTTTASQPAAGETTTATCKQNPQLPVSTPASNIRPCPGQRKGSRPRLHSSQPSACRARNATIPDLRQFTTRLAIPAGHPTHQHRPLTRRSIQGGSRP